MSGRRRHRFAGVEDVLDPAHLLHADLRRVGGADDRGDWAAEHHAGIGRLGDAIGEGVIDGVGIDEVAHTDPRLARTNGSHGRVVQLSAERHDPGRVLERGIVDDVLDEQRLLVEILVGRGGDRRLIGAGNDSSLIVEQDE